MQLFESYINIDDAMKGDTKYSRAIKSPQYIPSDDMPHISELYDYTKYSKLLSAINKSDVPEEVKTFLKLAASRHIVFNYARIADYYAHADKKIQELMEQSALVILDIDDAIANGYVKLSAKMNQLVNESKAFNKESSDG